MDSLKQCENKNEAQSRRFNRSFGSRQRGVTAIAMALILVLVAFFALIFIRLAPIYIEHFSVSSHLQRLAADIHTSELSDKEILDTLRKRFDIDDVDHVDDEDITIDRESGPIKITIEYEVRTPALGNVDMIVSFYDEVTVK